ncbi:Putative fatty acyl-CoA reductase [Sarcoptes scabiei]|uniref:Fatty acyl-CoA reductase n=1 Tax=Sarcoptes scabiei TaxID=52283 RepID=A0A834VDC3_SARSC|nr:Putative fatty acyl-CoA reductase [Sarcoptes scabiei]
MPPISTSSAEMDPTEIQSSTIASFYAGKSIFITGATGFMGKVLVEKLLRSCSQLNRIFVLLRAKKNIDPIDRLNDLLNSPIFDRIREKDSSLLEKVTPIAGDIVLPGLGISKSDTELLSDEVSIVFHSAATVKFDEPMRTSINFNTLGTRHMLELCRKMKNLQAFVHVSTAYSNCDRHNVDEIFYPFDVSPNKLIELNQWMDDDTLNAITPNLLGKRPNTYTYTKALAEMLLLEESGTVPVSIVRPSIVTASWREPFPGWIDNINGPTGLVLACGKGLLRSMLNDPQASADLIPVDIVINLMITVAWITATKNSNQIKIYNCTSGTLNTLKWRQVENFVFQMIKTYPSIQVFRYPGGHFKQSSLYNRVRVITDHLVPAYLIDGVRRLCWKKPILVRVYAKLHRAIQSLEYFTTRDWNFSSRNVVQLTEALEGIDKQVFEFDVRKLVWSDYWRDYVLGIRKFVLKEDEATLPLARTKLQRIHYIQNSIYITLIFLLSILLVSGTPLLNSLIDNVFSLCFQTNPFNVIEIGDSSTITSVLNDVNSTAINTVTQKSLKSNWSLSTWLTATLFTSIASIIGLPNSESTQTSNS